MRQRARRPSSSVTREPRVEVVEAYAARQVAANKNLLENLLEKQRKRYEDLRKREAEASADVDVAHVIRLKVCLLRRASGAGT